MTPTPTAQTSSQAPAWTPSFLTVRLPARRGGPDQVTVSVVGMSVVPGLEDGVTFVMDRAGREWRVYRGICTCLRNAKLSACEHADLALAFGLEDGL